jgi:hypothetical protein
MAVLVVLAASRATAVLAVTAAMGLTGIHRY